ncbi:MAG: ribonuclease HII [Deltaproteobacteria bacterium]|nr:ribonuclease HII [Deltaproteobacteria bacterium]
MDEAGRGPLAGPVVAAAVILPQGWEGPPGLDDSKKMTHKGRQAAEQEIKARAVAWRVTAATHDVIDRINILQATLEAMARAVNALQPGADYVLVDGNRPPTVGQPLATVVRGDSRSITIAAASVLAKTARDKIMAAYAERYPQWGFEIHKGYPTQAHRQAIRLHGTSPIHRLSFRGTGGDAP